MGDFVRMGQLLQRDSTAAGKAISTLAFESVEAPRCLSGKKAGFTPTGEGVAHELLLSGRDRQRTMTSY
jgi:hypothetical protein